MVTEAKDSPPSPQKKIKLLVFFFTLLSFFCFDIFNIPWLCYLGNEPDIELRSTPWYFEVRTVQGFVRTRK